MELKELKKEIDGLSHLDKTLSHFKNSWLKQIKPNTNQQFPFLQKLDYGIKREINHHLEDYQKIFHQLKYAQFTQEKLSTLAHYLIELKLSSLSGDTNKPKVIVRKFISDDFLKLKNLIDEVNQIEFNLNNLKQIYDQTNQLLLQHLPLECSITLMDCPHKNHLNSLLLICQKQKKLLKTLGIEFIDLTTTMKKQKRL